jgi:septum site-determining protein MinC
MPEAVEFLENPKNVAENEGASEILLKGTGYGVRIIFPEGSSEETLLEKIRHFSSEATRLTRGMDLVLDFQGRTLSKEFLLRILSEFIWPGGFRILSWISYDADTLDLLRSSGFSTGEPAAAKTGGAKKESGANALLLVQSLRSGQRVEHEGDVVLLGHVNEGAEICASGSIFVWGRLKGVVHAGMGGGEHSISAGQFEAKQVRLGGKLCSSLGREMDWWGKAVIITLENDSLVVRELKL